MTPTEKGRRVDALNQGPDTRRVLCDMIASREADLEDARAENAKLRVRIMTQKQTIQAYRDESREWRDNAEHARAESDELWALNEHMRLKDMAVIGGLEKENEQLKDDNAKLRELIAEVHEALCADKAGMFHRLTLASMEDDMRELGVEVDE